MKIQNVKMIQIAIISAIAASVAMCPVSFTGPVSAAQQQNEERGLRRAFPRHAFVYQGQLKDGDAPAAGAYDFRFTLHAGQTDVEELGSIGSDAIILANGFFKVELDFGAAASDGKESWLEIAVRPAGGAEPYVTLSPRQRLTSTPYAIFAQQGRWSLLGVPVGFVDAAGVGPHGERINRDAARQLETAAPAEPGGEKVQSNIPARDGMLPQQNLDEAGGWTDDGTVVRLTDGANRVGVGTIKPSGKLHVLTTASEAAGQFEIKNTSSSNSALYVSANGSGAALRVSAEGSGRAAFFSSNSSNSSTTLHAESVLGTGISSFSNSGVAVFGQSFSATKSAGHFQIYNTNSTAAALFGETNGDGYGVFGQGKTGVYGSGASFGVSGSSASGTAVYGLSFSGTGGKFVVGLYDSTNPNPALEAVTFGLGPAGRFHINTAKNSNPAILASTDGTGHAVIARSSGKGLGAAAVFAESEDRSTGEPGGIAVYGLNHSADTAIVAENTGEGDLLRGISKADQIVFAVRNNGTTVTKVLQITGGADLSENFEVRSAADAGSQASPENVRPGMVVSIDPKNPTQLVVSSRAYDRRVVGIISGAGGIKPGMLMSQTGSVADGEHPVALSGRVWVQADATRRAIQPGDLLTTAGRPGHAMKAADHGKAQGAIIGKAMTGLKQGTGLVLVLVSLQ